jgi:hypothetical protein
MVKGSPIHREFNLLSQRCPGMAGIAGFIGGKKVNAAAAAALPSSVIGLIWMDGPWRMIPIGACRYSDEIMGKPARI